MDLPSSRDASLEVLHVFSVNCISLMVQTGAKGSMVNHSLISFAGTTGA